MNCRLGYNRRVHVPSRRIFRVAAAIGLAAVIVVFYTRVAKLNPTTVALSL